MEFDQNLNEPFAPRASQLSANDDYKLENWKEFKEYEGDNEEDIFAKQGLDSIIDVVDQSKQPKFHLAKVSFWEKCCKSVYKKSSVTQKEIEYFQRFKAICQPYNEQNRLHEECLRELWILAFPLDPIPTHLKSPKWKELGFQNFNPRTDFRGGGVVSLYSMMYLLRNYQEKFHEMMEGKCDIFFFAITSINITFFLLEYFHLIETNMPKSKFGKSTRKTFKKFCLLNAQHKMVFYELNALAVIYMYYTERRFWAFDKKITQDEYMKKTIKFIELLVRENVESIYDLRTLGYTKINRELAKKGRSFANISSMFKFSTAASGISQVHTIRRTTMGRTSLPDGKGHVREQSIVKLHVAEAIGIEKSPSSVQRKQIVPLDESIADNKKEEGVVFIYM